MSNTPVERRPTAMLFQGYSLWPHMSVSRNIGFGLELRRRRRREINARVGELLELVGLEGYGGRRPHELSGGQQQRVALARSLALEPRILLLDEPFSSLDLRLRLELRNAVREIQRRVGTTTILVTHDQDEALELSDHIVVMSRGHVEQIGNPAEIYERPQTRFVAEFIGTMNFFEGRAGQHEVALGDSLRVPVGEPPSATDVGETFGVRPEDVAVDAEGGAGAPAVVKNVTLHGHYKELQLDAAGLTLRAYASKDLRVDVGDDVTFRFRRVRSFGDPQRPARGAAPLTDGPGADGEVSIPGAMGVEPEGR
jgi:putative spermidine/putrescine transport system ATP-binding protein